MNKHKVVITITGKPESKDIKMVVEFDPPLTLEEDSNTLAGTVNRMMEGLQGRITAVDGEPRN